MVDETPTTYRLSLYCVVERFEPDFPGSPTGSWIFEDTGQATYYVRTGDKDPEIEEVTSELHQS